MVENLTVQSTDVLVQNVHSHALGRALQLLRKHHPKPSTRPRNAAQPNEVEKKVQCGPWNNDSWIFARTWTPGRTCRFCCHPCPKPAARAQSVGKRTVVDAGTAAAGGAERWSREILQQKLDVAEREGDEGVVKNIRASCPDHVSNKRGDGGVDLWISLTKQMQQLW